MQLRHVFRSTVRVLVVAGVLSVNVHARAASHAGDSGTEAGPYLVVSVIQTAPKIDGSLEDACWKGATWHDADRLVGKKGEARDATRFAVARDDARMYFAIRCDDLDPANIVAKVPREVRDGDLGQEDHVRILISPQCTREGVCEIRINANGAVTDLWKRPTPPGQPKQVASRHGLRPKQGEPLAVGRVTDTGYQIELAFRRRKSFLPDYYRVAIHAGESWLFNLSRVKPANGGGPTVTSWTGTLPDEGVYGSPDGGFGSMIMGPADVAITRPHFGDGTIGIQSVRALLTNLTDQKQELLVKVWGEGAGLKWGIVRITGPPGVGKGFEQRCVLLPGQTLPLKDSLEVTNHRRDIRISMEVRRAADDVELALAEHFFVTRAPFDLHLHETEIPSRTRWVDIYVSSDLPEQQTEGATVEIALQSVEGEAIGPVSTVPFGGGRREIGYILPPELAPAAYALHGRLISREGTDLAKTTSRFTLLPHAMKKKPAPQPTGIAGVIPLTLREMAGASLDGYPITFGVPLPDGLAASAEELRLVDAAGNPIPFHARAAARWRKTGHLKWALFDALVDSPAGATAQFQLRYGQKTGGSHSMGAFSVQQGADRLTVKTGPLQFTASQASGRLIDRIWVDGNGDGRFTDEEAITKLGAGLVATITHEDGTIYTANMIPGAGLKVEEVGEISAVLKAEGWFELPRTEGTAVSERLCKYVVRIRAMEGSHDLKLFHTFVFTGESAQTRLKDISLTLRMAGEAAGADFGAVAADGVQHLSLLQHGPDAFAVFNPNEGMTKPRFTGEKAPGWVALATERGSAMAGVRDFWQLYPKELEVEGSDLRIHLWPAHGKPDRPLSEVNNKNMVLLPWIHEGELLDFQTPEVYKQYDLKTDPHNEMRVLRSSYYANALGLAKTHEIVFSFAGAARSREERAALGRLIQEPPICAASPEWMCDTNVFGAVKMNPVDRERFPRIEAALENWFDAKSRLTERVKAYGMFNYLDAHSWFYPHVDGGRLYWWRVWANTHHGGPRVAWLMYGRSGDPKYLRAAHRRAVHHMDLDICHHTNPYSRFLTYPRGKVKAALNDYKGFVHWYSGNRLFDYNTIVDYLFYDYYLTGNRRALDVAMEWGAAVLKTNPSETPGRNRAGAGVLASLCFLYEETGNTRYLPYIQAAQQDMLGDQMEDGYFSGFWTTFAPWRGRLTIARDGADAVKQSLRRWCQNVTEWRYNDSTDSRPTPGTYTYLNTYPISEDLASGYFLAGKNPDFARLALGNAQMFAWGMYEGEEDPSLKGWNGVVRFAPTMISYMLQTIPFGLRAVADHGEPLEPLFRRSIYTSKDGITAYLDVRDDAVLHVSAMVYLANGGEYTLTLTGPKGATFGPVPLEVGKQRPQPIAWTAPKVAKAGEWKLVIAGKKSTSLVRLHVPEANRITYKLPSDEIFAAPAIYFYAPQVPGKMTWQVKSRQGEPNGSVLVDPDGNWAGRSTWLDLEAGAWHDLTAQVTPQHAGKTWLFGARLGECNFRPPEEIPPYFAYTREELFIPQRP